MIKNGWYICPHCGRKLARVEKAAISKGIYVFCKHCKLEVEVRVLQQE